MGIHWNSGFPINAAVLEGPQGQRVIQFLLPGNVIQQVPAPAWPSTPTAITATYHVGQGVRLLIGYDNGNIVEQPVLSRELAPHEAPGMPESAKAPSSNAKPYFKCPVSIEHTPEGAVVFVVTRRDGSVERIAGPPGVTRITSNVEAFQKAGEDGVELVFAGG